MARANLDFAAILENPFAELKRARTVGWLDPFVPRRR